MTLLAAVALRRRGLLPTPPPVGPGPVASVTVSPPTASIVTGGTRQLVATARDATGGDVTGRPVTWTTSNAAVATVSATGLVTAVAAGAATITATVDGVAGTSGFTVGEAGDVVASFELLTAGASVSLHDLSFVSGDGEHFDSLVDWGDGEPTERMRCHLPAATDPPVRWLDHAYKTAGPHTVTLTASDALGNTHTALQSVAPTVPGGAIPEIPRGRFHGGRDQYPGVDPRRLRYGQPREYLDTTRPTEAALNPALALMAASKAELTAACQALGATGGTVYYTSLTPIDAWTPPDRPYDGAGVRHETWIWVRAHASVLPPGFPAEAGVRITPALGLQLPAFRATSTATSAITFGDSNNDGRYRYRYRFTGFGITTSPTYNSVRTGGQLVNFGELSHRIVFEQCHSYLPDEQISQIGCRRDFYVRGGHHAWIDGWHWGNRDNNSDSQGIGGWTLNGPMKIVNCFITGAEPWMTGGSAPTDSRNPELPWRPRDVEVRMCHSWRDQGRVPMNIRYYDGSSPIAPGRTIALGVPVAGWDAVSRTLTLAAPVPVPDGSFARPNPALRTDYVIYVRSGTGAGQGARVSSFTNATTLVLTAQHASGASPPTFIGITTPLDATSVIELRLKILWWSKNNGEFKDCRAALISECVFENGSVGIDSQYYMNNFKTTVNSAADFYPFVCDVTVTDCVYLNTNGGITMSALPLVVGFGAHGQAARRFHLENLLMLAGDPEHITSVGSGGDSKFRPFWFDVSQVHVRGVTAIGYNYGILGWGDKAAENRHQSIHGLVVSAPTAPKANAYWFAQRSGLDDATSDLTGNAVCGVSSMPTDAPGAWYCEPTPAGVAGAGMVVAPARADLWGAATDYELKPALAALRAATPERLDWARLKAATSGVRADPSIIPYQWD